MFQQLKTFSPIQLIQDYNFNVDRYFRFLGVWCFNWHFGDTNTMTNRQTDKNSDKIRFGFLSYDAYK